MPRFWARDELQGVLMETMVALGVLGGYSSGVLGGYSSGTRMSQRLISLFIVATFAIAGSGSAFAADITVKASPPAPFYNWTGWYVGGGQVGYNSQLSPTGVSR